MKIVFKTCIALLLLMASLSSVSHADEQKFTKQQLDQMLAPIALYPDDLLSNVLMASTYPLDVVEAARWRKDSANAGLTGDALVDALKAKSWDPSIKALVQFPDVLNMMSTQLDWTQTLGDAFLAQQDDVMNEVQFLRQKADSSGHLRNNSQQTVTQDDGAYVIRPADPDTVYVPVYEPSVVYGPWWYPDYPPYYWGYPGAVFTDGFFWGAAGIAIAGGIWGWNNWDWHHHRIDINANRWNRIDGDRRRMNNNFWRHDARHRGNIPRGAKHLDRADIERRLQRTDHKSLNNNFNHGEQLRRNGREFNKARGGKARSGQVRRGPSGKNFAKPNRPHNFRARPHANRSAVRAHRGGGGGRRGRRR
ncbi:MAG: DUF3300 domain-containing protein [Hyphomicrobium sp.]|uniref:DUF3300 domain-containing protein n=1 Tax=Hyphomicrobium sp. TaxID=82 RepID=UPI0039E6385F